MLYSVPLAKSNSPVPINGSRILRNICIPRRHIRPSMPHVAKEISGAKRNGYAKHPGRSHDAQVYTSWSRKCISGGSRHTIRQKKAKGQQ